MNRREPMQLPRVFDVRPGEGRLAILGFAGLLLSVITAHTVLETARDALLLTGPGPRALGLVYMAIAACTFPASALAGRAGARFGPRRALAGSLAVAAGAPAAMFVAPPGRVAAIAVYVLSGVIASVVVPLFWTLVANELTLAQGRRLFGFIAAAGVLGGVLGSGLAAAALSLMPARGLLLVSSGTFVLAGVLLGRLRLQVATAQPQRATKRRPSLRALRGAPYLLRVALIVVLSTATLLTVDYLFKTTIARTLPRDAIGPFVARYYLALNVLSLAVQLIAAGPLVRALGVATAVVVTPLLLTLGGGWVAVSGGVVMAVLLLKGIDGSLRHSIHRITGELLYLPVPSRLREQVKPVIDGAIGRTAQTLTGAALLALAEVNAGSERLLGVVVVLLAGAWLLTALTVRRAYFSVLRSAIRSGSLELIDSPFPLDLESAQLLVQRLASEEPREVVGAMNALARRGRAGFVPALVLLHSDEDVLASALALFAASPRTDWIPLATRLLADPRERVRVGAARALATHGALEPSRLLADAGDEVHGYAALWVAMRRAGEITVDPQVRALLEAPGERGQRARLGLLAAAADAPPSPRLGPLLRALGSAEADSPQRVELLARAAAKHGERRLLPQLVGFLSVRAGREAVRHALVALGEPAFQAVLAVLVDPAAPRRLRVHVPKTLAQFGSKRAAERLLDAAEHEPDGLVRYKSILALGRLAREGRVAPDGLRIEHLCRLELITHFRILGLRVALRPGSPEAGAHATTADRLLVGLLDDKLRQSLERAFQLLKVRYPREEIHHVYLSCRSGDARARATAGEFLDVLLDQRGQPPLRDLFRLIADDLSPQDRASRAASVVPPARVASPDEALVTLMRSPDAMLGALAGIVALERGTEFLRAALEALRRQRPTLDVHTSRLLESPSHASADHR